MGDYYRVPADTRDLNYGKFFDNGDQRVAVAGNNSHNTVRLDRNGLRELLLKLVTFRRPSRASRAKGYEDGAC